MKSAMPYRGVTSVPLRRSAVTVFDDHPLPDRDDVGVDGARAVGRRGVPRGAVRRAGANPAPALRGLPGPRRRSPSTGTWSSRVPGGTSSTRWPAATSVGRPGRATRHEVTPRGARLGGRRRPVAAAYRDHLPAAQQGRHRRRPARRDALEANLEGSRHGREFFVRKALGWALRQHARVDPDWVRAFVAEHHDRMSGLSRREALKHL